MAHEALQFTGHPEITIPDYSTLRSLLYGHVVQVETSVNVLELQRTVDGSVDGRRLENIDHEALVRYLERSNDQGDQPTLRILFLNNEELNTDDPLLGASVAQMQVALNPATIDYLVQSLGVSPIFLSTITTVPWLLDTGNALFKTYDSDIHHASNISSIQGFFRLSDRGRPSHVWFKHDIVSKSTTYIIQGCPQRVMDVLDQWTEDKTLRKHLLRPLALESLLIDEVTWAWSKGVVDNARKLLEYEHFSKEDNADRIDTAVHALHNLSQHFHILQEELNGMVEQLDYLIGVHHLVSSASFRTQTSSTGGAKNTSVADSLQFLRSRTHNWQRWVNNWKERTNIRIHLFFNLATQRDNGTNASIAHFTSDIATETHKDSSAMMTIAILTLVFLPGTFIAAVLSMPMVEQSVTNAGAGWKLYVAITIPLTFVVIMAWNLWRRFRNTGQTQKHITSRPVPEAPPLNSVNLNTLPSRIPSGKNDRTTDSFGDKKFSSSNPHSATKHHPYDLRIHIPPRSPFSDSPTTSFPLALSKALSEIDSRRQVTTPDAEPKPGAFLSKFRSISRRRTATTRAGPASAPASIKNRTRSPSPAAFRTTTQSQTPASASPILMRRDEPTNGRTVLDPNSPPFEGYGMWVPDPIHEPLQHHSGRSTDYIPLSQLTQRTSTIRSRFSSRRQSRGSGVPSRRSSRRSSPMVRGSASRRSSLLRSRPQSNAATPARSSPVILPGRPRSNSALIPGEVRFAQSLSFERGRSPTRSIQKGRSSSSDSGESLDLASKNMRRRRPSASSIGSLGINLHSPSPAPSQKLAPGILRPRSNRTPSPGPSARLSEKPHHGDRAGGWPTTSPPIPIQRLPPPFAAMPSVLPLASSSSIYYDAPSTPLLRPLGFPLFGQQPPSPHFLSSPHPWTSQFQRLSSTPFNAGPFTGADPTDERLVDTSRNYPAAQGLMTALDRKAREPMEVKSPSDDFTGKANLFPSATERVSRRSGSNASKMPQRTRTENNDTVDELEEDGWLSY